MTYKGYQIINEGTKYSKSYSVYTEETNDGGRTWKPCRMAGGYKTIEEAKGGINAHFGRI